MIVCVNSKWAKKIPFELSVNPYHSRLERWRAYPLFAWLDEHVGPFNMYKQEGEPINGQNWRLCDNLIEIWDTNFADEDIKYYIEFDSTVDQKLITAFRLIWG